MKNLTILLFATLFHFANLNAQCSGLSANAYPTDVICYGNADGTINSSPTGGFGPYFYQLLDPSNNMISANSTGDFTGLTAGSYNLVIQDQGNACYDTTVVIVNEPTPVTFTNVVTDNSCNGLCDGAIDTYVTGGTGGYTYNWMPGGMTTSNITGLCSGTYQLVVTDANGCNSDSVIAINEPTAITVVETISPDNGSSNGSITITVGGGSGSYIYSWVGPNGFTSTSQNIAGLPGGVYTVDVTDANGCYSSNTYTIPTNSAMTTTFWTTDPWCFGSADGGIQVDITGGSGNYNFEITDPNYNVIYNSTSVSYFYGLVAGGYYYIVTDLGTNDADTNYFEIYDPMPVMVTETITDASCGQCNGAISLNVTGGITPYSVSWSNGSTTFNQSGLCPGTYSVDIYDANGCLSSYSYTIIDMGGTTFTGTTTSTDATCSNCDGSISFTVNGGTPPYQYMWDDPTIQTANPAINLCPGIYTLSVTDASGCTMVFTDTVNQGVVVNGSVISTTSSSCLACTGTAQFAGSGGTGPYTYVNVMTQDTNTTGYFDSLCPNVQYVEVIDANGCSGIVSYTIAQLGLNGLNYSSVVVDESGTGANNGSIDISYDSVTYPDLSFIWTPDSATTEDIFNLSGGNYWVYITDSTTGGCAQYNESVSTIATNAYITGFIYQDNDNNCSNSSGDGDLSNVLVTITDGTNTYTALTNNVGYYYVLVPNGTYTVTPTPPTGYSANCGTSSTVTVAGSMISGVNFGYYAPPFEDLCTNISSWGFVPGFTAYAYVYYSNHGNVVSSGELTVVLPAGMSYLWSGPTPTSINGDTLTYTLGYIAPSSSNYITIALGVPTWFQIGDPVEVCSSIDLLGGGTDVNLACNNFCYSSIVTGSYDPNDKAVQPMGIDTPGYIETNVDEFTYTIRFQNTGTAPAHNVYVTDTLDAMLDRNTLQVLSASHAYNVEFYQNDVVRFRFDNIMLPDSNVNEPESHGFIQFKINTANTPQLTETVENTANIYFDYNEPVITNTTLNTYADFSSVEYDEGMEFQLYPNPTNGMLFTTLQESVTYKIIDLEGKMIINGRLNAFEGINVNHLSNGLYFLEVTTSTGIVRDKFTKQ